MLNKHKKSIPIITSEEIKSTRAVFNMTQSQFSEEFRFPLRTLQSWESDYSIPSQTASVFLQMIKAKPKEMQAMIRAVRNNLNPTI